MTYVIFGITQTIGLIILLIGMAANGDLADRTILAGGKIMLGGAMLACCVKYLFS